MIAITSSARRALLGVFVTATCLACSSPAPPSGAVGTASPPAASAAAANDPDDRGSETRTGMATYIAPRLDGQRTASGEPYDSRRLVAAHPTYQMGTRLRVTNQENGRTVEVTVIDRSASGPNRPIVDLSRAAAEQLGFIDRGTVRVTTEVIGHQAR